MNARFVGKRYGTGYERNFVFLEYEYRGFKYEVYENRAKGNEPLAWQHKSEQNRIDQIIENSMPSKGDPAEVGFNLFWEFVNAE